MLYSQSILFYSRQYLIESFFDNKEGNGYMSIKYINK